MSTEVFPSLPLIGWPTRTEQWKTRKPESISGKQTALADWSYPRHQWDYPIDVLRQFGALTEFSQVVGFYDLRGGGFDSFLYADPDDNAVTGQALGVGDGTTTAFQLVRALGGYVEPIFAPNVVVNVYLNGVAQPFPSAWGINVWGSPPPGVVTFATAPGAGVAVTADFTYYFPCRFVEDKCEFQKFAAGRYTVKKLSFASVK